MPLKSQKETVLCTVLFDCTGHACVLQGINPQASLIECCLTASPPALESILSLNAFDLDRLLDADSNLLDVSNERHAFETCHLMLHSHNTPQGGVTP